MPTSLYGRRRALPVTFRSAVVRRSLWHTTTATARQDVVIIHLAAVPLSEDDVLLGQIRVTFTAYTSAGSFEVLLRLLLGCIGRRCWQ